MGQIKDLYNKVNVLSAIIKNNDHIEVSGEIGSIMFTKEEIVYLKRFIDTTMINALRCEEDLGEDLSLTDLD